MKNHVLFAAVALVAVAVWGCGKPASTPDDTASPDTNTTHTHEDGEVHDHGDEAMEDAAAAPEEAEPAPAAEETPAEPAPAAEETPAAPADEAPAAPADEAPAAPAKSADEPAPAAEEKPADEPAPAAEEKPADAEPAKEGEG